MTDFHKRRYHGEGTCHYRPLDGTPAQPEPYIPSPELVEAVNMALHLRRPLLIEGEPGCGKTRLAFAVAHELGYPLYEMYIRSTTKAQDLLYSFDAVRRLYDLQEQASTKPLSSRAKPTKLSSARTKKNTDVNSHEKLQYIDWGELGKAIRRSAGEQEPSVVLIDEIDKADIDFPNDLLLEMDRMQFGVKEIPGLQFDALQGKTREERKDVLPLVIVTSNREKELPAAFLRRCLFYYIPFPDPDQVEAIIERHFERTHGRLFEEAVKKFWQLREQQQFTWQKMPSTSELIDWLKYIELLEDQQDISADQLANMSLKTLPNLGALVKKHEDLVAVQQLA